MAEVVFQIYTSYADSQLVKYINILNMKIRHTLNQNISYNWNTTSAISYRFFFRPTQPFILNWYESSTSVSWDYGGEVASVRWRVIPCDPIDMWTPVAVRWVSLTAIPAIIIIIIINYQQHSTFDRRHKT